MTPKTTSITTLAKAFFEACERGKGWEVCGVYCTPNATFSAQAEPLVDVKTLAQYTDWMKGILTVLPDAHYEVSSFATDIARNSVAECGVILWDPYWPGRARSSDGAANRHGLRLRDAI